jgi:replicative DNA helicase
MTQVSGREPKLPPHSKEAEQSVLGALMLDARAWDDVSDCIRDDDFYEPRNKLIFAAMQSLAAKQTPFDVLTVAEILKEQNNLAAIGGDVYLFELTNSTPAASNVKAYADIVRERSIMRQLISAGNDMASNAFNPDGKEAKDVLDKAERAVFSIAEQRARGSGPVKLSSLLTIATDRLDELQGCPGGVTGVATGFNDLDNMTSGLQPADLVIVAGRPSMGKTAFSMNIAEHASINNDKPVLVFSMEMPGEALALRMLSSLGSIDQHKLRTGDLKDNDWPNITSAVNILSNAKMYIDDTPALTPTDMRARARRVARQNDGLSLIIIDYMQLMHSGNKAENRATEISEISRSLKALAKELNVPVVALSQLNRSLEQRQDKRPVMSDLRESGAIEQDADIIMFVYRDEVYNDDSPYKGTAEIIIAKHRNGPIGKLRLTFLGRYTKFENYTAQEEPMAEAF